MVSEQGPYLCDPRQIPRPSRALTLDEDDALQYAVPVRVLIVGAGIIGVSLADALARRGAQVHVLDRRGPGRGASYASAGILAPYTEAQADSPLLNLGARSLALFDDLIADLRARTGIPIEYARSGTLEISFDDDQSLRLQSTTDWLETIGIAADWLEAEDIAGIEPSVSPHARGGILVRSHGYVGVTSLLRALIQSARLSGATFESPIEAVEISASPGDLVVRANGRPYDADAVIVAAGSWSSRIRVTGIPAWPVRPIRGQLIELEWPEQAPQPSRVVWGPDCYCVPWSTGSLLVGATSEDVGFDEHSTVEGVRTLLTAVTRLLPDSCRAAFGDVRVGLRPASADGLPIVGPIDEAPGVMAATGHYRNGVLMAPLTAQAVSRYLLDGAMDDLLSVASPNRFEPTRTPR